MPATIATSSRLQAVKAVADADNAIHENTVWGMAIWFKVASAFTGVTAYAISESGNGGGKGQIYAGIRLRDGLVFFGGREQDASTTLIQGDTFDYSGNVWQLAVIYRNGSTCGVSVNGAAYVSGNYNVGTAISLPSVVQLFGSLLDDTTYTQNFAGQVAYGAIWRGYVPTASHVTHLWNSGKPQAKVFIDGDYNVPSMFCLLNDDTPYVGGPWTLASTGTTSYADNKGNIPYATDPHYISASYVGNIPDLLALWTMQNASGDMVDEIHQLHLTEEGGAFTRFGNGLFGPRSLYVPHDGRFLSCTSDLLALHGKSAQVSLIMWARKFITTGSQFGFGRWSEDDERCYGMFLSLGLEGGDNVLCGHFSGHGGANPPSEWSTDVAIGATQITQLVARQLFVVTFDGRIARTYLNGRLDSNPGKNPYKIEYPGLYAADPIGGLTVGVTHYLGVPANKGWMQIDGLGIVKRCLTSEEVAALQHESVGYERNRNNHTWSSRPQSLLLRS